MEKYIEQNGITYELRGEQYYPLFELPEQKEIGKWGLLRLGYLKRFAVAKYNELLTSGGQPNQCRSAYLPRNKLQPRI